MTLLLERALSRTIHKISPVQVNMIHVYMALLLLLLLLLLLTHIVLPADYHHLRLEATDGRIRGATTRGDIPAARAIWADGLQDRHGRGLHR